jgi:hypothetical protein
MTHAVSSAKRYGGIPEDYLPIHDLMDSSKAAFPDNRHRALTHNSWFFFVVEKVFGHEIDLTCTKCEGTGVQVEHTDYESPRRYQCVCVEKPPKAKTRYVCEQHVLEDFGGKYIPTASDYLEGMEFQEWMNNGISGAPTSHRKLARTGEKTRRRAILLD